MFYGQTELVSHGWLSVQEKGDPDFRTECRWETLVTLITTVQVVKDFIHLQRAGVLRLGSQLQSNRRERISEPPMSIFPLKIDMLYAFCVMTSRVRIPGRMCYIHLHADTHGKSTYQFSPPARYGLNSRAEWSIQLWLSTSLGE